MVKNEILCAPIRDTFWKYGDKFEKIAFNEANGMYCYKRTSMDSGAITCYEVFKAPKEKRGDGEPYDRYPSSSDFGFGSALCIRADGRYTADKIAFYMANGFDAGRYKPKN